jgi:cob(I)alamin adenosyltransferase
MLIIYTGNGKGKTSACVGQTLRALGQGLGAGFYKDPQEFAIHRDKAQQLLSWAGAQLESGLDMLVLDEALYALGHGFITREELQSIIDSCGQKSCHLVLSGRGAPDWLVLKADIVSDITEVRHIYNQGGQARPGIEF